MSAPARPDTAPPRRPPISFVAWILGAMALGAVAGIVWGEQAAPLAKLGGVIIGLIKALAGPLLFFAIIDTVARTDVRPRSVLLMVAISLTNACIAVGVGFTLSNTLLPGRYLNPSQAGAAPGGGLPQVRKIQFWDEVLSHVPTSVVRPFVDNAVISIVFLAVLAGVALRCVRRAHRDRGERGYRAVEVFVATTYEVVAAMLGLVIRTVPVAVFGVVAGAVGKNGFAPLRGLAAYVGVAILGLAIQVLVVYQGWLVLVARVSLRRFWSGAREALIYALGASSSLATLPVTLRCLEGMGVSKQSASLAACVGTNLNNDGILLYEAMAALFVAQVYGIPLSLAQQAIIAVSCVLAGIGIAAVPDAGLISLALVLATVVLPVEIVPLLLTVDWLLSRCRALTNVTSDMLVAVLLDRLGEPAPGPASE